MNLSGETKLQLLFLFCGTVVIGILHLASTY